MGTAMPIRFAGFDPPRRSAFALLIAFTPPAVLAQPPPPPDPDFLKREQAAPLAPRPTISGVEHTVIHYNKNTYCGHPREVLFQYFGGGEILLGHYHAPCRYEVYEDVRHVCYQARSVVFLQRSTDGGKTWPKENDSVAFEQTMPPDAKRAFLFPKDAAREAMDMFRPESALLFARTHFSPDHEGIPVCFSLRSADKGRTWERVPTVVANPRDERLGVIRHNTPVIRMPDGRTLLAPFQEMESVLSPKWEHGPVVLASVDQGVSWQYLSRPVEDRSGRGHFIYPNLLLLPDGELQFYTLHLSGDDEEVKGLKNALAVAVSKDGGKTWTAPVPIAGKGGGCWKNSGAKGNVYRSPYPIRLRDGRILLVFARRRMPGGIGGIVSADGGKTWSEEFVIRDDGAWWDLGYPVGCQLEDGRIFIAYYFNMQDGNKQGGTRYIAGTFFRLE